MLRFHSLVRILRAATVLAVLYALGVLALAVVVLSGFRIRDVFIEDSLSIVAPFAILFGFAFIVLAVARRLGFVLLWIILVSLWVAALVGGGINASSALLYRGAEYPSGFVLWSVLALPLFAMNSVAGGGGAPLKIGPWSVSTTVAIGVFWILLLAAGVLVREDALPDSLWASPSFVTTLAILGWLLWAPMPLVIAAVSVRRFWVETRRDTLLDAAA
jgi:hypothetical protein